MTSNNKAKERIRDALIALSNGPQPLRVVLEMNACRAIDNLALAQLTGKNEFNAAIQTPNSLGEQVTATELRRHWIDSNLRLQRINQALDVHINTTIQAVKAMLALD